MIKEDPDKTKPTLQANPDKLSLEQKLEILPTEPGVYLFKDTKGKIIYIGKAKVLRNRVRSYFTGRDDGRYQYHLLVARIADLEIIVTDTELEALILEATLIRRHRPRFNMDVRDDRTYPYLKVTNELYPRVFLTRKPKKDKAKYHGPLTDVTRIKDTLRALRRACKLRTCNLNITETSISNKKHRVCLEYHIGNCLGPCEGLQTSDDYSSAIRLVIDTMQGKASQLLEMLERRMKKYSRELKFEEAARVRDQIMAAKALENRQKVVTTTDEDRDVFGYAQEDRDACIAVLRIRNGKMIGRSHSFLSRHEGLSKSEIWSRYLVDYYLPESRIIPDNVLIPDELVSETTENLVKFLEEKRAKKVELRVPQRGEKVRMVELAKHNAELLLNEYRLAKQNRDRTPHSLTMLKEHLELDSVPGIIECFDNSNLMGTHPVASMVQFKDARPLKKEYRHFKIKTVKGIDDFASMKEVVGRRYSRLLREKSDLPDLIVIDGGTGQLNAAHKVLSELGLGHLPVIGLAKRLEEIWMPGTGSPITLPKTSSALKLLMQIRDEAHRFAITFHRKLRSGAAISSTLQSLPGIGEEKAKSLLKHFGSVKKLREASVDEIAEVNGFGPASAKKLFDLINSES